MQHPKAVVLRAHGGPDVLEAAESPLPERARARARSREDRGALLDRRGTWRLTPPARSA